jgi:hypothetical protein
VDQGLTLEIVDQGLALEIDQEVDWSVVDQDDPEEEEQESAHLCTLSPFADEGQRAEAQAEAPLTEKYRAPLLKESHGTPLLGKAKVA